MTDWQTYLKPHYCKVSPTGSQTICNPAPIESDYDYLVECDEQNKSAIFQGLIGLGFHWEGATEHYKNIIANTFCSLRRDKINIILTCNKIFAANHRKATAICKGLNLLQKADRLIVFKALLYDDWKEVE